MRGHPNMHLPVQERFEMKVDRSGECHRWTSSHVNGYGSFQFQGRYRRAHVVALILAGIEVPEGMTVDHVWARGCKHRDCVRVDHLEVVTNRENILRSNSASALAARKTHCDHGHEFTAENTGRDRGKRYCKTCNRERQSALRLARKAEGACERCGHGRDRHGPETGGCVECRCRSLGRRRSASGAA